MDDFSGVQNCVSEAVLGTLADSHLLGLSSLANHANWKEIWELHLHFGCHMPNKKSRQRNYISDIT